MRAWRGFGADLAVAGRRLREAPGFTLVCVLTLALGIGGNTAVFTLIDRVLLKPLPVPRPSELYRVGDTDACCVNSGVQGSFSLFSYDLYTHLRDAAPEFTHLAAVQASTRAVTIGRPDVDAPAETLNGAYVSGNYFQLFELSPAAGRLIQPDDDVRGAAPVGVLSHTAWSDRFQARTDILGRTVTLNGVSATIVGVAPQGFYGEHLRPNPPDLWMPLSSEPLLQPAARLLDAKPLHWLYAIGRVKPGAAVPSIQARLTATLQHWLGTVELTATERAEIPRQRIAVIPAPSGIGNMRDAVAPSLRLLQALAAAVLLVACANLASLLLARGAARRTEMAMRVALGASRMRLIGQLLIESILLAGIGGAAGLVVSFAGARAIVELAFRGATTIPVDPSPSWLVIGFAFAASLVTGVLFGVAPAIIGSRSNPIDALRGATRTTGDRGGRLRGSLISLQVAMSLVLITCAGLLGRSLAKLESQDFGVRLESRYVVALAPSLTTVAPEELASMYARMQERLLGIPGSSQCGVLALRADVGRQLVDANRGRRGRRQPNARLRPGTASARATSRPSGRRSCAAARSTSAIAPARRWSRSCRSPSPNGISAMLIRSAGGSGRPFPRLRSSAWSATRSIRTAGARRARCSFCRTSRKQPRAAPARCRWGSSSIDRSIRRRSRSTPTGPWPGWSPRFGGRWPTSIDESRSARC